MKYLVARKVVKIVILILAVFFALLSRVTLMKMKLGIERQVSRK